MFDELPALLHAGVICRQPLNNARLLPFGLYDQWVPAFVALFEQAGGDWATFYQRAAELGELPLVERERALAALAGSN